MPMTEPGTRWPACGRVGPMSAPALARVGGRRLAIGVALLAVTSADGGVQPVATTADLHFMAGCWQFERNGRRVEEHWLPPAGGSLLGVSRTVAGGRTVEYEFLQIRDLPEGLTYIARPSGQAEASFRAVSKTPEEIVFENPEHDFPQRIRYRRVGDTGLHARIEGAVNGRSRTVEFPYARVKCEPQESLRPSSGILKSACPRARQNRRAPTPSRRRQLDAAHLEVAMLLRRELLTAGVAGSLTSVPEPASVSTDPPDREGQREIARRLQGVSDAVRSASELAALNQGFAGRLRAAMEQHLKAAGVFPEFIDVGPGVFFELYDWHVRYQQPLTVSRVGEGRYALQFMFSWLVLRPEMDRAHVGIPYERI